MSRTDLRGADLRAADLQGVELCGADLRGADLRGVDLAGRDLSRARLIRADLSHADLTGCNLRDADLSGACLRWAGLRRAALARARLVGADLRRADLTGANLVRARLSTARLDGAALPEANLDGARLERASLRGADLRGAVLRAAGLGRVDLRFADARGVLAADARLAEATLLEARFDGADLWRIDARFTDWRGARLSGARLADADLTWSDLSDIVGAGLDLTRAELDGAVLTGDLEGAVLDGARLGGGWIGGRLDRARLAGVDLRWATLRPLTLAGASLVNVDVDPLAVDVLRRAAGDAERCVLRVGLAGGVGVTVDVGSGHFTVEAAGTWPEPRTALTVPVALPARARFGPRADIDPGRQTRGVGDPAFDDAVAVVSDPDFTVLARLTAPVRAAVIRWVDHGGRLELGVLRCSEPADAGARLFDAAVIAQAAAEPVGEPGAALLRRLPNEPRPAVRHRLLARWLTAEHRPRALPASVEPDLSEGALHDLVRTGVEPRWAFEQLAFLHRRRPLPALDGVDLTGARLAGARLADADLRGVVLAGADLSQADLKGADLSRANLANGVVTGARLTGADLRGARLASADLGRARLDGADLEGANLDGADLRDACLDRARLVRSSAEHARFAQASLRRADLTGAQMAGARFIGVVAEGATFDGADLARATFAIARLTESSWLGAVLRRARFTEAILVGARMDGAQTAGAVFDRVRAAAVSLVDATLDGGLVRADLRGADLRRVRIGGDITGAMLAEADLRGARLAPASADGVEVSAARVELPAMLQLLDAGELMIGGDGVRGSWRLHDDAEPGTFAVTWSGEPQVVIDGGGVRRAQARPARLWVDGVFPLETLRPEDLGAVAHKVFVTREPQLGDPAFDDALFIKTAAPLTLLARLGPEERSKVVAWVQSGGRVVDGRLEMTWPAHRLGQCFASTLDVARMLSHAPADEDAALLGRARTDPVDGVRVTALSGWMARSDPPREPPADMDRVVVESVLVRWLADGTPSQRVYAARLLRTWGSARCIAPLAALAAGWFTPDDLIAAARSALEVLMADPQAQSMGGLAVVHHGGEGRLSPSDDDEH